MDSTLDKATMESIATVEVIRLSQQKREHD